MRGDLNEQFQRAQAASEGTGPRKWLIALVIGFLFMFLVIVICGTIFLVNTFDKFVDTPPADSNSSSYSSSSQSGTFDPFNPSGSGGATRRYTTDDNAIPIEFGTVTGTSYFSSFSGISFSAPSDWTVTSASGENFLSSMTAKDLVASNSDMSCSASISYKSNKSLTFKSAADTIADYKATAQSTANTTIIGDNLSASIGGNKFSGIAYKKTIDANYSYYTEVLVTELKGYVLEIYVEANTESDLNAIMGMFK